MDENEFYNTNTLIQNFPQLFDNGNDNDRDNTELYRSTQLEIIGNGWAPIVNNLCKQLMTISQNNGIGIKITLIKEKWGGLRIHWHLTNQTQTNQGINSLNMTKEKLREIVSRIVEEAKDGSANSCWECGNPAQCDCHGVKESSVLNEVNHPVESCKFWNKEGWQGYFLPWCKEHW